MRRFSKNFLLLCLIGFMFVVSLIVFYASTREAPFVSSLPLYPMWAQSYEGILIDSNPGIGQSNGSCSVFVDANKGTVCLTYTTLPNQAAKHWCTGNQSAGCSCPSNASCTPNHIAADGSNIGLGNFSPSNGNCYCWNSNNSGSCQENYQCTTQVFTAVYDKLEVHTVCLDRVRNDRSQTFCGTQQIDWEAFDGGAPECFLSGYMGGTDECQPVITTPPPQILPCGSPQVCVESGTGAHCESSTNVGFKETCYSSTNCVIEASNVTYPVECDEKIDATQNRCKLTDNACPAGYTKIVKDGLCGCTRTVAVTTPPVTTPPQTTPPQTTPPQTTPPQTTPPQTTPPETTPPQTTPPQTTVPVTTPVETTPPQTTAPVTTIPVTTVIETTVPPTTVPVTTIIETTIPVTTVPVTTVIETTLPPTTVPVTTIVATTPPGLPKTDTIETDIPVMPWVMGAAGFFGIVKLSHTLGKKYSLFAE